MNIEIGKRYSVTNRWKKSFTEVNEYENEDGQTFTRTILWRTGSVIITPANQDEVNVLTRAMEEDWDGELSLLDDFEDVEFDSTWDGISEDYESDDIEGFDEMYESFYEDEELQDNYFGFDSYMEEVHGYDYGESYQYISGSIMVEESTY